MAEEKKLEVKNLKISFRTSNGKVQAVRNISFDLYKGETLAIVGESGSGKSVTSRAIMGILAGNAIVEGGKILYDGKDLMKISEDEFHEIRGDKIAMVFQDPLSSLNPIMKVGAQLTEAMLLKNKAARKDSKKSMEKMLKALAGRMEAAKVEGYSSDLEKFKKFGLKHCELQADYVDSLASAEEALAIAQNLELKINGKAVKDIEGDVNDITSAAKNSCSYFVVRDFRNWRRSSIFCRKQLRSISRIPLPWATMCPSSTVRSRRCR
jgi:ABC-type sugar transport system ATPase subunit